jgi:hypothetical protein
MSAYASLDAIVLEAHQGGNEKRQVCGTSMRCRLTYTDGLSTLQSDESIKMIENTIHK